MERENNQKMEVVMFQEIVGNLTVYSETAICATICITDCTTSCVGCVPRETPSVEVRSSERIATQVIVRDETV